MTWFKVDDSFYDHPKVEQLSLAARGLWVTAGTYAARHLTDGFVPDSIINRAGRGVASATRELYSVGMWLPEKGGIRFHDWDQFQPSRESVEADRLRTKERQKAWRERKRNAVTNGERNSVTNAARGDGAPTRPDPTNTPISPTSERVTPSPTPLSATADGDFETFWTTYPRAASKDKTRAAWHHATATTDPDQILDALHRQLPQLERTEPAFRPASLTWLRDQRWLDPTEPDEPDPWAGIPHIGPNPDDPTP